MSTQPQPRPSQPRPRPGSQPQSSQGGGAGIDPVKLLNKYKFVLVASVFIGGILGVASHILLSRFAPLYTSEVIFVCSPAEESIETIDVQSVDETEMDRFIGTQVATIRDDYILSKVITDARLTEKASKWSSSYLRNGNINTVRALDDFKKMVSAHAIQNTFLMRVAITTRDPGDAAGLVELLQEAYLNDLNAQYSNEIISRREAIRDSIQASENVLLELSAKKDRLVRDERIDSIDSDQSTSAESLRLINSELVRIQQSIEALTVIRTNDEAQLQRDSGIDYDSTIRAEVEDSMMIQTFKSELKQLETFLVALQARGIKPSHRQYKSTVDQIDAHNRKIEKAREELLRDAFEARVQNTVISLQQLQAQEAELLTQKVGLEEKLTELTRISQEIEDIDLQIEARIEQLREQDTALSDLESASSHSSAKRVQVKVSAKVPDLPTFPKIIIMIPAGVIIIVGLTVAGIMVFELTDQRIKSPADIRLINRATPLGMIMDANEDPANHENIGTAFSSNSQSVFAEHIRQLRTSVNAEMDRSGHKTLAVVSAMPKSGGSTVVSNLALACALSGQRVLVIDANFRRPSIHSTFNIGEGNGLGDILSGQASIQASVVNLENGPSVLRVGTPKNRRVELLSSHTMKTMLQEVRGQYDLVIFDVAPAIVAGDAILLAGLTDASLLVARALNEKRGQIARVVRELSNARAELLGVLVNGVKSSAGGYMRKNIRTSFNYRPDDHKSDDQSEDNAA